MNNISFTLGRALLGPFVAALALIASAETPLPVFSVGPKFQEVTGEALYRATCQGCHMEQGQGAKRVGAYPALAQNARLASAEYALDVVLNGRKGMPAFGKVMTDEQIAAVVGYARSHFGNAYSDSVPPESVKKLRP